MSSNEGFAGDWNTTWTSAEGNTGTAPLSVTLERQSTNFADGIWVTNGQAVGWMHGKVDANTWEGTWWTNNFAQHGGFRFQLVGLGAFTGTYTQAETGDRLFPWNGTRATN